MISACYTYHQSGEVEPPCDINRYTLSTAGPPSPFHGNSHPRECSYPRFCLSAELRVCALPYVPLPFSGFKLILKHGQEAVRGI
jgi:hypothetical protein